MKEISLTLDCEVTNYVKEYVIYPNQYTGNHMTIEEEIDFMFDDDLDVKRDFLQKTGAIMQQGYINFEYGGKKYDYVFCQFKYERFLDKSMSNMWKEKFYKNFKQVIKKGKLHFVLPIKIYDIMGFECANLEEFKIREIFAIKKSSVTNDGDRGRSSVLCTGRQKNTQRSMFEELRFKIIK